MTQFFVSQIIFRDIFVFLCKILILDNFRYLSTKSHFPEACRPHPERKYILFCNLSAFMLSALILALTLHTSPLPLFAFTPHAPLENLPSELLCILNFSVVPYSEGHFYAGSALGRNTSGVYQCWYNRFVSVIYRLRW